MFNLDTSDKENKYIIDMHDTLPPITYCKTEIVPFIS